MTRSAFVLFLFVGFMFVVAVLNPSTAMANDPVLIGTYNAWSAYKYNEAGKPVCYMVSTPKKAEGNYTRRGDIYALVTHRPSDGTRDVFSYMTGYTYKEGSSVTVNIDDKAHTLFTKGDTAWTPDAAADKTLATAIRAGSSMVVKGTSSRGTLTTDTFSLAGSTAAYNKITAECF